MNCLPGNGSKGIIWNQGIIQESTTYWHNTQFLWVSRTWFPSFLWNTEFIFSAKRTILVCDLSLQQQDVQVLIRYHLQNLNIEPGWTESCTYRRPEILSPLQLCSHQWTATGLVPRYKTMVNVVIICSRVILQSTINTFRSDCNQR